MSKIEDLARKHLGLNSTDPNYIHTDSDIYDMNIFKSGYETCQKEYEEKLRWIYCYEKLPKTAELVIVDSGNDLHACVAVAFYENEEWKYANGQKLWFRPIKWRHFL